MARTLVRRTYLCSPDDLPLIKNELSQPGASVCISPDAFQAQDGLRLKPNALSNIEMADEVVYVLSKHSDCSTAYQVLILASIPEAKAKLRARLIFDKTPIPLGIAELRSLPDVGSIRHQVKLFLHQISREQHDRTGRKL